MRGGLDICIEDPAWTQRIPDIHAFCRRVAGAALMEINAVPAPAGIAVLLTGDREMTALNARWRGKDRATNVLSLAIGARPDSEFVAGDIALAFGTVAREAETTDIRIDHRLAHLLVHGILHLAGHDHGQDIEAERMEAAESRALARLGMPDPHAGSACPDTVQ